MPVFSTNIGNLMQSNKNNFCIVCKKLIDKDNVLSVADKDGNQRIYHQICYDTAPTKKYKELHKEKGE